MVAAPPRPGTGGESGGDRMKNPANSIVGGGAKRNSGWTSHNSRVPTLQELARALLGEIVGNEVLAPGPGHSAKDRSLSAKPAPNAPDGFVVHSFAGDDWRACRGPQGRSCQGVDDFWAMPTSLVFLGL